MNNAFVLRHELMLLQHPFYQAWMAGELTKETLRDYASQYYKHVEAFPSYLRHATSLSSDKGALRILEENLEEEDGTTFGTSHPELWLRFAEGLGCNRSDVMSTAARSGIANVVDAFTGFSKKSYASALGSLYAYESQVPEIAQSKIEGLVAHYGIQDERTLSFFELHKHADVDHRASLLKLIEALSPEERREAQAAADASCSALWGFLTDVSEANGCTACA